MVSETPNPDSVDLDLLSTKQVLSLINSADHQVPKAIAACLDDIEQGVDLIVKSFAQQGRLIIWERGHPVAWVFWMRWNVRLRLVWITARY